MASLEELEAKMDRILSQQQELFELIEGASTAIKSAQAYLPMLSAVIGSGK